MQPTFEPMKTNIQQSARRLSIIGADQAQSTSEGGINDSVGSESIVDSMHQRIRLRAEDGASIGSIEEHPQELLRVLGKTKMVLDAKRSQLKKMQKLSKLRFIGRLISHSYLSELSDDIAWYEAVVAKTANTLNQLNVMPNSNSTTSQAIRQMS